MLCACCKSIVIWGIKKVVFIVLHLAYEVHFCERVIIYVSCISDHTEVAT